MPTQIQIQSEPSERIAHPVQIEYRAAGPFGPLNLPSNAIGIVMLSHFGSLAGDEPQHRVLVQYLTARQIGVLQVGLLNEEQEPGDPCLGFFQRSPGSLAERLLVSAQWVRSHPLMRRLPMGCLGFGSGGTVTLMAAAALTAAIDALVVADGQPDMVGDRLSNVLAATLLVVSDTRGIQRRMNEIAYGRLRCERQLKLVPDDAAANGDAAEERVARLAADWFHRHLRPRRNAPPVEPAARR